MTITGFLEFRVYAAENGVIGVPITPLHGDNQWCESLGLEPLRFRCPRKAHSASRLRPAGSGTGGRPVQKVTLSMAAELSR